MAVSITAIENHLMQLPGLHWINRRENPNYSGNTQLPAVTIDYAYSADGQTPISRQTDALDITITTTATDRATGSEDIDGALAIDDDIASILDGWGENETVNKWRRVSGGNVSRETGRCQTVIRYRRDAYISACE